MTVPLGNTGPLDDDRAGRVERVEFGAAVAPARGGRRIATRDEMVAAATQVFARRGPGRHRKPVARGRWVCAASGALTWLTPVLWACLQLSFAASVISAVAVLISPVVGVAVAGLVLICSAVLFNQTRPSHRR
ncbi:hypothetical protein [Amycolatopsis circi]|uniref:hypothetical protein n=1 Tax=Amycolatopsis circi TaxID=871959 RepID=UPI000E24C1A7|nr:hypothetical protein [Amycolatopsis circi]